MKTSRNNRPFEVFVVREEGEEESKKSYWTKIGVAFPHKSGKGFNVELEAAPLSGRLVVREPKAKDDRGAGQ
jgi:hypothetical protein